jgi:TonB family protein
MSNELVLNNLLLWSIQMVGLLAIATLFPALARLTTPSARLAYWQFALLTCLALPILRPWQQLVVVAETPSMNAGVRLALTPNAAHSYALPATSDLIVWALALGVAIRLGWICAGFLRLAKYRRHSVPLEPATSWAVEAELLVSDAVGSPVTFGFLRPVVLLPPDFANLPEAARDAVLCHEILHVRRRDWLFTLAEELVRAVFWFHPGIWWTLGEIQLAREQTVDRAVIDMLKSRDAYVDALLTIAGASAGLDVAPAPLFLRKRHLKQRVVSILKEVRMSPKRTFSTLAAGIALLSASCWFVTAALPLQGAPQSVVDGEGVSVQMNGAQLMHRAPVSYPRDAMVKGVEGNVVAQVKTDGAGNVVDASILSGPDELRKPVLQSVLGWHFAKDSAQSTRQVTIGFVLPKDAAVRPAVPASVASVVASRAVPDAGLTRLSHMAGATELTIKAINVVGLSDDVKNELLKSLPVHEGDTVPFTDLLNISKTVHEVDEHLSITPSGSPSDTTLTIRAPEAPLPNAAAIPVAQPGQIRVGAQVQAANLINQVRPEYPPLAKEARVQGTVTFGVTIAKDGTIANLNLISGPPLLVQAAMQAVQQWQYKPTLLNGQPVEVVTTVDVNFTLSQ